MVSGCGKFSSRRNSAIESASRSELLPCSKISTLARSGIRNSGSPAASCGVLPARAGCGSVGQRSTIAARRSSSMSWRRTSGGVSRGGCQRQFSASSVRETEPTIFSSTTSPSASPPISLSALVVASNAGAFVDRQFKLLGPVRLPTIDREHAGQARHRIARDSDARFRHRPIEQHVRMPRPRLIALRE